jgi:hypothetical protein
VRHRFRLAAAAALAAVALAGCASGAPTPDGSTTGPTPVARTTSPRPTPPTPSGAGTPTPAATGSDAASATAAASPSATAAASQGSVGGSGSGSGAGAAGSSGGGSAGGSSSGGGGTGGGSGSSSGTAAATTARPTDFDTVVGTGTAASCTSQALADAVRTGGSVGFWCGPDPVTITVTSTLYTCNTATCRDGGAPVAGMTLDGGGTVTLSGGGARTIFYAASCADTDKLGWVNGRCDFDHNTDPKITFRNIAFVDGSTQQYPAGFSGLAGTPGGGGAILMFGGTLTLQNVTFRNNACVAADPDAGGGAVRLFGSPSGVTVSRSRFEGNHCANGGAISILQAPLTIAGSTFAGNYATGHGNNAGQGGNGGAVYVDGRGAPLVVRSTTMTGNRTGADAGGSAIFYYAFDNGQGDGTFSIDGSTLTNNTGDAFYRPSRGIWYGEESTVKFSATSSTIG